MQQQPFKPRANLSYEERVSRKNRPANRALCYGNYAKSILMRIALYPNSRILEFGCGPGTNILKLEASTPAHVLFVDKDPECIRQASDRFHQRTLKVDISKRLKSCSFQCIDFLSRDGVTITDRIAERNFDTVLAFYSLQYIAAAPEIAKNFFKNCDALTVSRATVLGIFPNAQRLFAAQHCAKKLFSISGLEAFPLGVAPRSGIQYTFQIEGQQAYQEYTLCTADLFAAARETFAPTVYCSVLEFIRVSENQHSALCSSLFRCIINNTGTAMSLSQAERQLIDLYDIVIFTKIK